MFNFFTHWQLMSPSGNIGVQEKSLILVSLGLSAIVLLGVAQLLVQRSYFLHLGSGPEQRGNRAIFIGTGLLIVIVGAGSLWVMHNASVNMMPMQMNADSARTHE